MTGRHDDEGSQREAQRTDIATAAVCRKNDSSKAKTDLSPVEKRCHTRVPHTRATTGAHLTLVPELGDQAENVFFSVANVDADIAYANIRYDVHFDVSLLNANLGKLATAIDFMANQTEMTREQVEIVATLASMAVQSASDLSERLGRLKRMDDAVNLPGVLQSLHSSMGT